MRNPKPFMEFQCHTSRYFTSPIPFLARLLNKNCRASTAGNLMVTYKMMTKKMMTKKMMTNHANQKMMTSTSTKKKKI